MKRNLLAAAAVALGLAAFAPGAAVAHGGATPKHGGIVRTANDLSFELVAQPDGAALYVADHGEPMTPKGMSGKLTVLNGAEKSEATLAVNGDRLEARGLRLASGAKVVATLQTADRKAITVRFTIK